MWDPPLEHPLRRMFAGLAEHAFFSHLGVADPPLIDYLSALLTRFVHNDDVYRLRGSAGQPLTELTEMVIEAERLPVGGRSGAGAGGFSSGAPTAFHSVTGNGCAGSGVGVAGTVPPAGTATSSTRGGGRSALT